MHTAPGFRQHGLNGWRAAERRFDAAFGAAANPLRHLGSIGFLCFWLLAGSGIVLYALLDTSVAGAYASIDALSRAPWRLGALLRGLHRYAADAFVIVVVLHVVREWLQGHALGFRRFSWLTGVPLPAFMAVGAIGGFWLNWDRLGLYSATATAEWLDALPLLAAPLARNFLAADAVSDRLFSLFVFVHLGVALLLVFGLWFHIQRITRAAVFPPRRLALGVFGMLALLAVAWPVTSDAPATLASVPQQLRLDWILLAIHPLVDATSPGFAWGLVAAVALLLFVLPFLPQAPQAGVAVVDAEHCNGCRRCFADCPYAAITMVPHPNGRSGVTLAQVDADLCAGCGICAGSCPSVTPLRRGVELISGIDMPQLTVGALRQRLQQALAASSSAHPLVVFGCDHGARLRGLAGPDVSTFSLLCTGQLAPSFVEYALRDGAAGVLVTGCSEGGCEFRLGQRWTEERLLALREPRLRAGVAAERLERAWAGPGDEASLRAALDRLRRRVQALPAAPRAPDPALGIQHG